MSDDLLPDEQRRRIIAEEEFRRAAAARFEREMAPRSARLARQVNAPIVLWLLSTVVVGLISLGYKEWQDDRQQRIQEQEVQGKTSAELYYRVSACDEVGPAANREEVETLLGSIIGLRPLYPDYQNTRLDALYLQYCIRGGRCPVVPDSILGSAERLRRSLKPVVNQTPIGQRLRDRSFLPQVRTECDRLAPVKHSIRSLIERREDGGSDWK
jgi:hypothetical protein